MQKFKKRAQSLVEYGLIMCFVAIVAYTVLTKLSKPMSGAGKTSVGAVTGVNSVQDYCADISDGASYNAATHDCSVP